jgi:predicted amidohydrolase YtcJ
MPYGRCAEWLVLLSCIGPRAPQEPDLVLVAGGAITMDPQHPVAEAVAIRGERILAVGARTEVLAVARRPRILELGPHAWLIPGFHDAHVHMSLQVVAGATHALVGEPRTAIGSALTKITTRWALLRVEVPVVAADRAWLDAAAPHRPVAVFGSNGAIVLSATARSTRLAELAVDGVISARTAPAAMSQLAREVLGSNGIRAAISAFLEQARRAGITSAEIVADDFEVEAEALRSAGQLTCRLRFIPSAFSAAGRLDLSHRPEGPEPLRLRTDGVKLYLDDTSPISPAELAAIVRRAVASNTSIVVHVLGERNLTELLQVLEANAPTGSRRIRIEHADVVDASSARRIAALGVPVCANATLVPEWTDDPGAFPLRRLVDAKVPLCLASDWIGALVPGRELAPLHALQIAVEQRQLTPMEALRAMTAVPAWAEGLAHEKGTLRAGALADLVVFDADPLSARSFADVHVVATVVGGRVVYGSLR